MSAGPVNPCDEQDERRAAGAEPSYFDIVFDGPPGPEAPRFVEVEDQNRRSINAGTWLYRDDGSCVLRIPRAAGNQPAASAVRTITITEDELGHFTVREGDRYCTQLCADEAMSQTMKLLATSFPGFPMLTAEQHAEKERVRQERLRARDAERQA